MHYQTFSNQEDFVQASTSYIKALCNSEKEIVYIGLSGGKTPLPIYQELHFEDIAKTEFFLVDERCVPFDNPDSNYQVIRDSLPEEAVLHPVDTLLPPHLAASMYSAELDVVPNDSLDLVILGLGSDGHTASLFPNDIYSLVASERVINSINPTAPNPPVRERVTMTLDFILRAKKILLLVSGIEKESSIEELLHGSKTINEFPAKKLLEHSDLTIYFFK